MKSRIGHGGDDGMKIKGGEITQLFAARGNMATLEHGRQINVSLALAARGHQ